MDADLKTAFLIAEALTKGRSTEELAALQIFLQTLSSLVGAELATKRSKSQSSESAPRQ